MANCNCATCQYNDEFAEHIKHVPEEHQAFFEDLLMRYHSEQLDNDVNKCIIDGTWADADLIIIGAREASGLPLPKNPDTL